MKQSLNTVTLEIDGKTMDFVIWGEIHKPPTYDFALLVPLQVYVELLKAVAVDEVNFYNSMFLYAILNGTYQVVDNPVLKEEVYHAISRAPEKRN